MKEGSASMKIDNNEKAIEALRCFHEGNIKEHDRLDAEFIAEVLSSGQDHCSCKIPCEIHGKCKECVISHRGAGDHLPCCFWDMTKKIVSDTNGICDHRKHTRT